jgi:uncharacterized SAM-binding protein YcdF (DUF218 family)
MTAADNSFGIQPLRIHPGDIVNEDDVFSIENHTIDANYDPWLQSIDIILLLGGGVPLSPTEPPIYVQRRCDVVAKICSNSTSSDDQIIINRGEVRGQEKIPSVICLSAGTAHLPQYVLPDTGLPLWESTASAAYLLHHPTHPVPANKVFVETTSYDTISNAFFARTVMTDIMRQGRNDDNDRRSSDNTRPRTRDTPPPPPQRVLVVTNEFHVGRTKAIFDWIFGAPVSTLEVEDEHQRNYDLFYLSCNNVGLTVEAIDARKAHEQRGEINVRTKLSVQYKTLHHVWMFLTKEHDFYSASKLVERAMVTTGCSSSSVLKLSYGKAPALSSSSSSTSSREDGEGQTTTSQIVEYREGKIVLTLDTLSIIGVVIASLLYSYACKK